VNYELVGRRVGTVLKGIENILPTPLKLKFRDAVFNHVKSRVAKELYNEVATLLDYGKPLKAQYIMASFKESFIKAVEDDNGTVPTEAQEFYNDIKAKVISLAMDDDNKNARLESYL
jgi:hypothetical protein